ncbi:MAG: response regulator, partial [Chitinivibrionales bacterium]|nr:response regulator [Chitinivibrionales bacterium]MBD3357214.1 response regulator [Chitinivibrionales bacterium]
LFSAYFVAIAFTALHHSVSMSILAGGLAAAQYTILVLAALGIAGQPLALILSHEYFVNVAMLLIVASISGLISRGNSKSVEAIVSSKVQYHELVHRLPQMLFSLGADGRFLWCNSAAYNVLGIPAKAMVGRSLHEFFFDESDLVLDRNRTVIRGTFRIHDFNGQTKWVECIVRRADKGDPSTKWEGTITDVTDRELAISQREEMVQRLFQYQKMESLGTLASGMAHDFNNILQTMMDLTARVEKQTAEDETKRGMELMSETLTDARFLVSELFALGRKKPLNYTNMNLVAFLRKIVPRFAKQLGEQYKIELHTKDEVLWVLGDTEYLKRVFQNLFGNARDAMPDGGTISVTCWAERRRGEVGNIIITVADTGTGIPNELAEKVFDPFFTTKKPGKGTGLGLALVRRIISLHNGRVEIVKPNNIGTTFRIEIPEGEQCGLDSDTTAILKVRIPTSVLILDDEPKIRDILRIFLSDLGYAVHEAASGAEGRRVLQEYRDECDVVVMDWRLGDEDAVEVLESLRSIRSDLIVIIVSGYEPDDRRVEELSIFRWFTKPYDKARLDLEIQRALHRMRDAAGRGG